MAAVHVQPPSHLVRATAAIPTIQLMTGRLIECEAAYPVEGGGVFFRVRSRPNFGELSKLSRERMLHIASQQDDADVDDPRKEDPLDFALWKGWSGQPDEPYWESPWGKGRPGWHVECSALCYQFLGKTVTIHGGGLDLVFPHHECEIAQSETAWDVRPFVRIWSHVAMVRMDGEKMSKSLGNMVFLRDLLRRYTPNAIRLFLLGHHYRQVWEWSPGEVDAAATLADQLERSARAADSGRVDLREGFEAALSDDLDTPAAIQVLTRANGDTLRELGTVLGLQL
jgi:L-cysteine:1D-myo-inositol 2-amino-2-deoxy-alpha-D-glucopyranoside ligase